MKINIRFHAIIIILGLITMPGNAGEQWYSPVDIGEHVDCHGVAEETLSAAQAQKIFKKDTLLSKKTLQKYERLRDLWLRQNGPVYLKKFKDDPAFIVDRDAHQVTAEVSEFSLSQVRIYILFTYGFSRWHRYSIVLGNYLLKRNSYIDNVFNLKELEKRYSYSFKKVHYGTTAEEVEKILGSDYIEYPGQSPQFRRIYYKKYNLEIVIQGWKVKYVQKGRPGWVEKGMQFKK